MNLLSRAIDRALELTVAPSFTRIGPSVRRRIHRWAEPAAGALAGKHVVVTGATSGIGAEVAEQVARLGASVTIVARDEQKGLRAAEQMRSLTGRESIDVIRADMAELSDVRRASEVIGGRHPAVHALVHNAGALDKRFQRTSDGMEKTIAAHVVGPYLMTELLQPALAKGAPARVVWVSSGGMYAEPLRVDTLELGERDYDGVVAYARAKRAQVVIAQLQAHAMRSDGIVVHSMHPGWVDTPGVARSLPLFRRVVGPLLRNVADGADTVVFLLTSDEALEKSGGFWLDRAERPLHRLSSTRSSDTSEERDKLLVWVRRRAGLAVQE